LLYLKCLNVS